MNPSQPPNGNDQSHPRNAETEAAAKDVGSPKDVSSDATPAANSVPVRRLIAGLQPVREALRAHREAVHEVWVARGDNPRLSAMVRLCQSIGVRARPATRAELDSKCKGLRHQGVVAFAPPLKLHTLDEVLAAQPKLLVLLDGITDPQNFGATVRSAVAFGADAILWGEHHAAPLSPSMFRASAGAVEHATLCQVGSLRQTVARIHEHGLFTVALDSSGPQQLAELDLKRPCLLVVGAEDTGIGRAVRRSCEVTAKLPMLTSIASLNASVAAATAIYEVIRQRNFK